jgi:tRNA dimethylallyltransferase
VRALGGPAAALVGPTASGKSALAHAVALALGDVEILCVDAMTVYRGMDRGTAKPTAAERAEVRYHLLDLVDPSEEFTVAQFQRAARAAAEEVWARGGRVLYVGGTGLYHRAVIDDLDIPGRYPAARAALEGRGLAQLYRELVELDPVAASRIEATNERRVRRALEVTLGAGRPFSSFGPGMTHYPEARVRQVALRVSDAELDVRVAERFWRWMDEGLLAEVEALRAHGLSRTARQAVGYRELLAHLEEGVDLESCVEAAILQSRRLARRQRRWFERDPRIEWIERAVDVAAALHGALVGEGSRGMMAT